MPDGNPETTTEALPTLPLNVLKSVGGIVAEAAKILREVTPETIQALGGIATVGDQGPEQDWVFELAEVADGIAANIDEIAEAINAVSTEPTIPDEIEEISPEVHEVVELTELELAVLEYARTGQAFRLEVLRKEVDQLGSLTQEEYKDFKLSFSSIRDRIATHLSEEGIEAEWAEAGKARGKNYRLIIPGEYLEQMFAQAEAPEVQQESAPEPQSAGTTEQKDLIQLDEATQESEIPIDAGQENEIVERFLDESSGVVLSANEKQVVTKTVEYLMSHEERKTLRDIIGVVFGTSRLPRKEENRLVQILNAYSDKGMLRAYGKSFGYKSKADQLASELGLPEQGSQPEEILTQEDIDLIEFVRNLAAAQGGDLNIGQIVRTYYQVQRLEDKNEYNNFISKLNRLADMGLLIHSEGSPWYAVPQTDEKELTNKRQEKTLASINTPVVGGAKMAASSSEAVEPEKKSTQAQPTTEKVTAKRAAKTEAKKSKPSGDYPELENIGLSDREILMTLAIIQTGKPGEFFQQKAVDLSSIEFSSDSAKLQAFSKLTKRLVESGFLTTKGSHGGKKYMPTEQLLVLEKGKPGIEEEPKRKPADKEDTRAGAASSTKPVLPERPLTSREQLIYERKAARFSERVVEYITRSLETIDGRKERISQISKDVADPLGITKEEGRQVVSQLVEAGHFYMNGSRRGSRLVSLDRPEEITRSTEANKGRAKESNKRLVESDVEIAEMVFGQLVQLQHVQQRLSLKKLIEKLAIGQAEEKEFRRAVRRLSDQGYLVIEKAKISSKSPHSKQIEDLTVKLPHQKLKERLKTDSREVLKEIRSKIAN